MNKVAQYYRELVASLSERLRNGERDIDALVEQARERVIKKACGRSWQTSPIKRSLNGARFSRTSIITGFITAEKW